MSDPVVGPYNKNKYILKRISDLIQLLNFNNRKHSVYFIQKLSLNSIFNV